MPKSPGEVTFFRPGYIHIDGGGTEARMSHPALDEMKRHAGLQRAHSEAMT